MSQQFTLQQVQQHNLDEPFDLWGVIEGGVYRLSNIPFRKCKVNQTDVQGAIFDNPDVSVFFTAGSPGQNGNTLTKLTSAKDCQLGTLRQAPPQTPPQAPHQAPHHAPHQSPPAGVQHGQPRQNNQRQNEHAEAEREAQEKAAAEKHRLEETRKSRLRKAYNPFKQHPEDADEYPADAVAMGYLPDPAGRRWRERRMRLSRYIQFMDWPAIDDGDIDGPTTQALDLDFTKEIRYKRHLRGGEARGCTGSFQAARPLPPRSQLRPRRQLPVGKQPPPPRDPPDSDSEDDNDNDDDSPDAAALRAQPINVEGRVRPWAESNVNRTGAGPTPPVTPGTQAAQNTARRPTQPPPAPPQDPQQRTPEEEQEIAKKNREREKAEAEKLLLQQAQEAQLKAFDEVPEARKQGGNSERQEEEEQQQNPREPHEVWQRRMQRQQNLQQNNDEGDQQKNQREQERKKKEEEQQRKRDEDQKNREREKDEAEKLLLQQAQEAQLKALDEVPEAQKQGGNSKQQEKEQQQKPDPLGGLWPRRSPDQEDDIWQRRVQRYMDEQERKRKEEDQHRKKDEEDQKKRREQERKTKEEEQQRQQEEEQKRQKDAIHRKKRQEEERKKNEEEGKRRQQEDQQEIQKAAKIKKYKELRERAERKATSPLAYKEIMDLMFDAGMTVGEAMAQCSEEVGSHFESGFRKRNNTTTNTKDSEEATLAKAEEALRVAEMVLAQKNISIRGKIAREKQDWEKQQAELDKQKAASRAGKHREQQERIQRFVAAAVSLKAAEAQIGKEDGTVVNVPGAEVQKSKAMTTTTKDPDKPTSTTKSSTGKRPADTTAGGGGPSQKKPRGSKPEPAQKDTGNKSDDSNRPYTPGNEPWNLNRKRNPLSTMFGAFSPEELDDIYGVSKPGPAQKDTGNKYDDSNRPYKPGKEPWNLNRKRNPLSTMFGAFTPEEVEDIYGVSDHSDDEVDIRRGHRRPPARFTPGATHPRSQPPPPAGDGGGGSTSVNYTRVPDVQLPAELFPHYSPGSNTSPLQPGELPDVFPPAGGIPTTAPGGRVSKSPVEGRKAKRTASSGPSSGLRPRKARQARR